MKLDSSTQRIGLVTAGAALVLLVVWYFAFWSPQGHALTKARAAHTAAEAQSKQLQTQIVGLQALEREIPSDKQKLARYTAAVPDNPQLAAALDQLQSAATNTHVFLSSIGPSAASTGKSSATTFNGVPSLAVSLAVSGTYPEVMSFLTALDNMPRTLVVTNLSLSGSGSGASKGLSGSISSDIFYAGQPTP